MEIIRSDPGLEQPHSARRGHPYPVHEFKSQGVVEKEELFTVQTGETHRQLSDSPNPSPSSES